MTEGLQRVRRRAGRPPLDSIALFLFVEAGCRSLGLSVHAFCARHEMLILNPTEHEPYRRRRLKGSTLRRRYTEFVTEARMPAPRPGMILPPDFVGLPAHLKALVLERLKAINLVP